MDFTNKINETFEALSKLDAKVTYTDDEKNEVNDVLSFQDNNPEQKVKMIVIDGSMFVYAPPLGGWAMMPPTGLTITQEILQSAKTIEVLLSATMGM